MFGLTIPGLPDWATLAVGLFALLVALLWAMLPFAVFGIKGRLESIEAQLQAVVDELRVLNDRVADAGPARRALDLGYAADAEPLRRPAPPRDAPLPSMSPPVPPPPVEPGLRAMPEPPPAPPSAPSRAADRPEPRLSWPPRR